MTNPDYKGNFKKEPLTLGLPVLDKDIIRAYMSELGKRSVRKNKKLRTKKYYSEMSLKRWSKVIKKVN
jgi:hypothetical protein